MLKPAYSQACLDDIACILCIGKVSTLRRPSLAHGHTEAASASPASRRL